jgi:hypothetical protein
MSQLGISPWGTWEAHDHRLVFVIVWVFLCVLELLDVLFVLYMCFICFHNDGT